MKDYLKNIYKGFFIEVYMKKRSNKKNMKELEGERVYLCPKCKSREVGKVRGFSNLFGIFPSWKCNKCKYTDVVFPQLNSRKSVIKKKKKLMKLRKD